MRLLITAFGPFAENKENSSQLMLESLPASLGGASLAKLLLPVAFHSSAHVLLRSIEDHRPDAVICFGLSAGESRILPETYAHNLDDARIPDNEGRQPCGRPVVAGAPQRLRSSLPIEDIHAALCMEEIPSALSQSAGTYVCNHVFYHLLWYIHSHTPALAGGFIHLPPLQPGVKTPGSGTAAADQPPGIPRSQLETAVRIVIESVVKFVDRNNNE